MRMTNEFEYMYLPSDSLDITHVLNLLLLEDLDCDLLTRQIVIAELDLSKRALSDRLAYSCQRERVYLLRT